ncbi:MAG: PAS domain S-box protein, partial [Bacteroidota bacterium]
VNPACVKMFGASGLQDMVGTTLFDWLHPDSHQIIRERTTQIIESGKSNKPIEIQYIGANGIVLTTEVQSTSIHFDGLPAIHVALNDISERKRSELAARKADARNLAMISNISDVIGILDANGIMTFKSPNIEKRFGWLPEDRLGTSGFATIHPDDLEYVQSIFSLLLGTDNSVQTLECRYGCKDGSYKPIELTASNLLNDPTINGILINYHDISARKAREEEKQNSEALIRILSTAINQSPVTTVMTDLEGNIEFVNPKFVETTGYSAEEALGQNARLLQAGEKSRAEYKELWDTILSGQNWYGTFHNRKKSGELYWESAVISPVKDEKDSIIHFLAVKEDITLRLKAEQEIKLKNEELSKLNAEKDKFFAIVAHDLRGPLGGFMGLTEMMADKEQHFAAADIQEMTVQLSRSARQTFNLLENLLEWSQMENGLNGFSPQKLKLSQVVRDCMNIVSESARKKEIGVFADITDEPTVFADKNMLKTVIRNLLSNAIKYTPNGGSVNISAGLSENNTVTVSVRDTGIGMDDELLKSLFLVGANIKRPGTQGESSTGLGLQLCKEFVEKQGGRIWVESEQEKGSVFHFTLPFLGNQEEKISREKVAETVNAGGQALKLNILIAEDDEVSAKLISIMVKKIGREVYRVKTGAEAVETCLKHSNLDLVFMDIHMPGIDGLEAARQIRQFSGEVIIIAQTTYGRYGGREIAIAAGCNDYIMKPYELETLNEMIKKHFPG